MSQAKSLQNQINAVRQRTIAVLEELTEKASTFDLPSSSLSDVLDTFHQKLVENSYKVLVVGEAKRGKSTFINALIGRCILPTDVDVATSQVFHIQQAKRETYRLRFEDNSTKDITAADLGRYGSQVMAEVEGIPRLDQIIRWIEVDIPVRFLPQGVVILDTPGLGSLYAAHEQITQRFIPRADAAIFVLDSAQPIIQRELDFIETILSETPNIFFIQTKIDQHRSQDWIEIQKRNHDILQTHFKDRLVDTRIWPISSTHLLKAAKTSDEKFLSASRYKALATALQAFLFRVAGFSQTAEAILVAEPYYKTSRQILSDRLTRLSEDSKRQIAQRQQLVTQRKQEFETDWGKSGQKRRALVESIQKMITVGRQSFIQSLGEIERVQQARIKAVKSIDEANQLNSELLANVIASANQEWIKTCKLVDYQCFQLLIPFLEAAESVNTPPIQNSVSITRYGQRIDEFKDSWWAKFKGAYRESLPAAVVGGVTVTLPTTLLGGAAAPLSPILAVPTVLWVISKMWGGWEKADQKQVATAQQNLRQHLGEHLKKVHQYFFNVDLASGRQCLVEEYFEELKRTLLDKIIAIAERKSEEVQAELSRLAEEAKLDEQQRQTRIKQRRQQLDDWQKIGRSMQSIVTELKELDRILRAI